MDRTDDHCGKARPSTLGRCHFFVGRRHLFNQPIARSTIQRLASTMNVRSSERRTIWKFMCRRRAANAFPLQLYALAHNLANFQRTPILPEAAGHRSMPTLRSRLGKIVAKVIQHRRSVTFQMAEMMVSRGPFEQVLDTKRGVPPIAAGPMLKRDSSGRWIRPPSGEVRPDVGGKHGIRVVTANAYLAHLTANAITAPPRLIAAGNWVYHEFMAPGAAGNMGNVR